MTDDEHIETMKTVNSGVHQVQSLGLDAWDEQGNSKWFFCGSWQEFDRLVTAGIIEFSEKVDCYVSQATKLPVWLTE